MAGQVDSRQLRRVEVRVDTTGGEIRGTGFFAAPGWVITCAHVVEGVSDAVVVPADHRVDAGGVRWQVAARSMPAAGGGALWPFPDLALLRADSEVDHLCPLL